MKLLDYLIVRLLLIPILLSIIPITTLAFLYKSLGFISEYTLSFIRFIALSLCDLSIWLIFVAESIEVRQ